MPGKDLSFMGPISSDATLRLFAKERRRDDDG